MILSILLLTFLIPDCLYHKDKNNRKEVKIFSGNTLDRFIKQPEIFMLDLFMVNLFRCVFFMYASQ